MAVYCSECEHYFHEYGWKCRRKPKMERNHEKEWAIYRDPAEVNKNNDCPDFSQKYLGIFKNTDGSYTGLAQFLMVILFILFGKKS